MGRTHESRNQGFEVEAVLLTITPSVLLEEFCLFILTKWSPVNFEILVPKGGILLTGDTVVVSLNFKYG